MNKSVDKLSEAFTQLLEKKPFNKITVSDIVQKSNVHRNTFYYHFQDIPSLLEYNIQKIIDSIMADATTDVSLMESLRPIENFMLENKKSIMNLYNSIGKDMLLKGMFRICAYFVGNHIHNRLRNWKISAEDIELLAKFQTSLVAGVMIDWLENQMSYDLLGNISRACSLLEKGIVFEAERREEE